MVLTEWRLVDLMHYIINNIPPSPVRHLQNRTKVRPLLEFSSRACTASCPSVDLISAARATLPVCVCGTSSVLHMRPSMKVHMNVIKNT